MIETKPPEPTNDAKVVALELRIAADMAMRSWRQPLREFAHLIEWGSSIEHCLELSATDIPKDLRSVVRTALQTPAPVDMIVAASNSRRNTADLRRNVLHMLAYPCTLLVVCMIAVSVVAAVVEQIVLIESGIRIWDTELSQAERTTIDQVYAIYILTGTVCWTLASCALLKLTLPAWAWHAFQSGLPIVGKIYGWLAISELLERLSLFAGLEESVAYDRLADSFESTGLHRAALHLQRSISNGISPDHAIASCLLLHEKSLAVTSLLIAQKPDAASFRSVAQALQLAAEKATSSWHATLPILTWAFTGTLIIASFAMLLNRALYAYQVYWEFL